MSIAGAWWSLLAKRDNARTLLLAARRSRSRSRSQPARRQRRRPTQWDILPEGGVLPGLPAIPAAAVRAAAATSSHQRQQHACVHTAASQQVRIVPTPPHLLLHPQVPGALPGFPAPPLPGAVPDMASIAATLGLSSGLGAPGLGGAGMAGLGGLGMPSGESARAAHHTTALQLVAGAGTDRLVHALAPTMLLLPAGGASTAHSQQATRHARRVYVGGLPPTATEQSVSSFFSHALAAIGGNTAGPGAPRAAAALRQLAFSCTHAHACHAAAADDRYRCCLRACCCLCACWSSAAAFAGQSVVNVYTNKDKNFAFVEFRTGGWLGAHSRMHAPALCSVCGAAAVLRRRLCIAAQQLDTPARCCRGGVLRGGRAAEALAEWHGVLCRVC